MNLRHCVKQCKKCGFYLERGGFHNVFVIDQPNGPLQRKPIKTFVVRDAPQLI